MSDLSVRAPATRWRKSFGVVLSLLAIVSSIISMMILAWKGFGISLDPLLLATLEQLERRYEQAFSFLRPVAVALVQQINLFFGLDMQLQPHWKHAFVLLWLYFSGVIRLVKHAEGPWVFGLMWGSAVALVGAILFGTTPLDDSRFGVLAALSPICAVIAFDVGLDAAQAWHNRAVSARGGVHWLSDLGWKLKRVLRVRIAPATLALVTTYLFISYAPNGGSVAAPGLKLLVVLILAVALHQMWLAIDRLQRLDDLQDQFDEGYRRSGKTGQPMRLPGFFRFGSTRLAVDMLLVLTSAAFIVFASNALQSM